MTNKEKVNILADHVKKILADKDINDEVEGKIFVKNNNHNCYGICIVKERETDKFGPIIYADEFILSGSEDFKAMAEKIVSIYLSLDTMAAMNSFSSKELFTKEYVKEHVRLGMVNTDMNRELLKETVHGSFEDLSYVFRVVISTDYKCMGSYLIKNNQLEALNISKEELLSYAITNTKIAGSPFSELFPLSLCNDIMWGYCEEFHMFGSAALMMPEVFKNQAEQAGKDLYIIPSSVNELLAVPISVENEDLLLQLIKDINSNPDLIQENEILSNSLYRYYRETNTIKKV